MQLQLPGFRPTREWFPGRYVANPGVVNRVTCRHRRGQHCSCDSATAPPTPAHESQPSPETGPTVAVAEVEYYLSLLWSAVMEAVHRFPDANAALNEVLARYSKKYPGPFGRSAPDPPFP
jgi:hypothetical protein